VLCNVSSQGLRSQTFAILPQQFGLVSNLPGERNMDSTKVLFQIQKTAEMRCSSIWCCWPGAVWPAILFLIRDFAALQE
jgi:hypothetical protein